MYTDDCIRSIFSLLPSSLLSRNNKGEMNYKKENDHQDLLRTTLQATTPDPSTYPSRTIAGKSIVGRGGRGDGHVEGELGGSVEIACDQLERSSEGVESILVTTREVDHDREDVL